MTRPLVQSFLLTMTFCFILFYLLIKANKSNRLTVVKDLRHKCCSEELLSIYDALMNMGIYVSPSHQCGHYFIPLALEPYNIAIFPYPAKNKANFLGRIFFKLKYIYFKVRGWRILYIEEESLQTNLDVVINTIVDQVKTFDPIATK